MQPDFNPGDKVLINRLAYLFSSPKKGDVIAFHDHTNRGMILLKKVEKDQGGSYFVVGINKSDSRKVDTIKKRQIIGKLLTSY